MCTTFLAHTKMTAEKRGQDEVFGRNVTVSLLFPCAVANLPRKLKRIWFDECGYQRPIYIVCLLLMCFINKKKNIQFGDNQVDSFSADMCLTKNDQWSLEHVKFLLVQKWTGSHNVFRPNSRCSHCYAHMFRVDFQIFSLSLHNSLCSS